jgi:tRNA threonylcarbamoyladenosine biosynthesis protein TsaB
MSYILSLETSTTVCSVALHEAGKLLVSREILIPQSHAARLAVLIEEVKEVSKLDFKQLSAIAVASGPGSYTGLRIGVSTAKGLCYALNVPLIAVETLDIMAHQVYEERNPKPETPNPIAIGTGTRNPELYCPMIDARRMEVYCKVFDGALNVINPVEAKVIDEHSFGDLMSNNTMVFFGDGSSKCKETFMSKNAVFIENIYPTAAMLGEMAHKKFIAGEVEDVVHFEPFYLKDFLIKKPAGA